MYVCMYIYTVRYVTAFRQFALVRFIADGGASWRLHHERCLQGIHSKRITVRNTICVAVHLSSGLNIKKRGY
jgi:hypothetical protein